MKNIISATKDMITIDKDQRLTEAMGIMDKEDISHLLVREGEDIVGIITKRDIVNKLANARDLGTERKMRATQFHVSSAMTRDLKTIASGADIVDAAGMMIEHGISSLPVVEEGRIRSIVTKTDLIAVLKDSKKQISEFYNKDPLTISKDKTVVHARKVMLEHGFRRLVVTDEDNNIEGIITEKDIGDGLRQFRRALDKFLHADVRAVRIEDVMKRNPKTITKDEMVSKAVDLMLENKISGLPVVDNELKVMGIITKTDLARAIAEGALP